MDEVILAPGVQPMIRPGSAIQFGVDATRAGILEVEQGVAAGVVAALLKARTPMERSALLGALIATGLRQEAAESLLDDLTTHRILRIPGTRTVTMLGRGLLAAAIHDLLESSGIRVRVPLPRDSLREILSDPIPVIVVNRLAHGRSLAPLLTGGTSLPVSLIDARGLIGPLYARGLGPCLMCVDLHRADVDKHWHTVVTQQPAGPTHADPVVRTATAARAAAWTQAMLGIAPPPGCTPIAPQPGDIEEVDPYNPHVISPTTLAPHPRCPLCWR